MMFHSINGSTAPTVINSMGEQVDFLTTAGSFAGVEGKGSVVAGDDKLYAAVDVEFFAEVQGDYYLGVYTVQNNIVANQSGQGMVQQPKLLTGAFTDEWYGIPIQSTTGVQSFEFEMDKPADFSSVDGDTEILTVIWNKVEDTYLFFNAHTNGMIESISSTNELEESISEMKASFINDQLDLKINASAEFNEARLVLTNLVGQKMFTSNPTQLINGLNELNYSIRDLKSGIYIVSLQIGDHQISKKVFK